MTVDSFTVNMEDYPPHSLLGLSALSFSSLGRNPGTPFVCVDLRRACLGNILYSPRVFFFFSIDLPFTARSFDDVMDTVTRAGMEALGRLDYKSPYALTAVGLVGAFSLRNVLQKKFANLIDTICNRTYIYNICWEDPAVDHEILKIQPDDVIFRICSAGDIVLDYAIEGPAKIVVCDMNQHQLWLFELKIRMLRDPHLTYDEWWAIWGSSDVLVAMKVWKRMRHTMSAGGRVWWDGRIERVFRNGYATSGSCGFAAKHLIPWLMWVVGFDVKAWADTGFSHAYISENSHIIENSAWWFRRIFPGILAPFAGVPPNQIGPEFYTTEFYEGILREIFLDPDFGKDNYFYRFYYEKGYKDQTCCPRTLKPQYFDALRANAGCFEWHHATVQETMERVKPYSFTKLVLLDHMDWMPNSLVHEEWIALQRSTVPGAKVLWRSAFTKMDEKPFFNNLDITDLSPEWYHKDRVKMYPGTFSCLMPADPFPFVDPEPSPCQRATFTRKLKTTTKMILHPLTAGRVNAHGDKMSSFYASQAKGYDAVRENMLVSRPEMMSGFGPIKKGHTWLDVGGGTGRNLHYLRAQLDLFERIVVLDICPELLAIGEENARLSFTPAQTAKISWVVLDINDKDVRSILAKHLHNDLQRGFDTISFSYSLSMIPAWEQALLSARSLMSADGRVIVSDFDTYTEAGKSFKDFLIRTWYRQDGVRIESKSRDFIANNVFGGTNFAVTMARFQRKLGGVKIPHYVACCRKETVTESDGKRRPSAIDLTALGEEKKTD
jgi:S-adenosylmethionine-diacylglycerol 3-amino-3-carboxypropyl transferase